MRKSKTGERPLRIIAGASLLGRYLESHPFKENPAAPLWVNESTNHMNERLTWTAWNRIMKDVAVKAGVNGKRIHHYLLRHGSCQNIQLRFRVVRRGPNVNLRRPKMYLESDSGFKGSFRT